MVTCLYAVLVLPKSIDNRSEATITPTPKYFGYMYAQGNFSKLTDHSNVFFARDLEEYNQILSTTNDQVILDTTWLLWHPVENGSAPWEPKDGWRDEWRHLWNILKPNAHRIAAIYPIDEPDMNANKTKFTFMADVMRETMYSDGKNIPLMAIFTPYAPWMMVDNKAKTHAGFNINKTWADSLPFSLAQQHLDWIGFDEYGCLNSECLGGLSLEAKFNIMQNAIKDYPLGKKSVFVVGDGLAFGTISPTAAQQSAYLARNQKLFDLCTQNGRCVGYFAFLYNSNATEKLIGLDQMPIVQNDLKRLGQLVLLPTIKVGLIRNTEVTLTASKEYAAFTKDKAVNGITTDAGWVSGGYAPQWLEFQFKQSEQISRIVMHVNQDPASPTLHRISVAGADKVYREVASLNQSTADKDRLTKTFSPSLKNITFVKIETLNSKSWIAWREIEFYR